MIRVIGIAEALGPAERYGLDVLLDLSRLLVLTADAPSDPSARPASLDVGARAVGVRIVPDSDAAGSLRDRPGALADSLEIHDGDVLMPRAVLRAVCEIAGGAVEQRSDARDRFDRVPSAANPLVIAGCERDPVVSRLAIALRRRVMAAAGRRPVFSAAPWPGGHRWAAALTHDLDVASLWPAFTGLRVAELLRKRRVGDVARVLGAAAGALAGDPVLDGVRGVVDAERRIGAAATWFVLCGTPTFATVRRGDLTYRPESRRVRRIVALLREAGHELALHGSFATAGGSAVFEAQRARLGALLAGAPPRGVRQHYLRMRPGAAQRAMTAAGFTYDATYGFPDRNGFRLGTADVVPGWDDRDARPIALDEVPLVWMDRAQSKYQGIEDPTRWIEDALALARAVREVDGLWVGLWHPNLTPPLGFPGAPAAYARLVEAIASEAPFIASVESIVAWRRARRHVHAAVTRDGAIVVRRRADVGVPTEPTSPRCDVPVGIEDAAGRPVVELRGGKAAAAPLPH